ncbi:MAG: hypothetical protein ABIC40_08150 [bacterium]
MCEECGCGMTEPVGEITHYFGKPQVAVVRLNDGIKNGDTILVKGTTTEFTMDVKGLRNEAEQEIEEGHKGELVAFRTDEKARPGDQIWLVMGTREDT